MLYYILQTIAIQLVFLLIYDLFLRKETFFNHNRAYLLITSVLSLVLPLIKIPVLKESITKDVVIRLPEVIVGELAPSTIDTAVALQAGIVLEQPQTPWWQIVFYAGLAIATLIFTVKLMRLFWLKSKNPKQWKGNILIVKLLNSTLAFSFFNNIFIGDKIEATERDSIMTHEMVHVNQKHTFDLLFFEGLKIIFWFNPLVYMYQNRIKTLHEFIADAIAVKEEGKKQYYQNLLNQVFETQNLSFTNTFFNSSLLKKRIAMLQKAQSKQHRLAKYALLIPMVFGMLIYTSADVRAQEKEQETITETIVVPSNYQNEKELVRHYYEKFKALSDEGEMEEVFEISKWDKQKFTMSLDEFARLKAFVEVVHNDRVRQKIKKGTATESEIERLERFQNENATYADYLENAKSEKYIKYWESRVENGVQKLFVKDLSNKTVEEQKKFDEKMALIERDDFWHSLYITDGNSSQLIEVDKKAESNNVVDVVDDVVIEEVEESIEVPFGVIEEPPIFETCSELSTNDEKRQCTSQGIAKFVNKNFNTELATELGLSGRQRISVFFKVDKEGNITSIGARAPHPALETEAKRVIASLPKMIPGKQRGKAVTVPYSLPILFQVAGDSPSEEKSASGPEFEQLKKDLYKDMGLSDAIPFSEVEVIPTYEVCKDLASKDERKKCTSNEVAKFVNKNFNLDLPQKLGVTGRQNIQVLFKISKRGEVFSVKSRASHPKLEAEAERVVSSLPRFIPGRQDGKPVDVSYALPITFQVHN
ncbi:energy transducer TonB [Winogradskyella maritima]|uniref:Energy transducer TonB n=1 Tax=Winogradskyella maritima TaxID=1517766 RepID=A0ABV8AHZ4_9FLAO|nr:energy transducer TonB [Winogradskyella maritima]